MSVSAKLVNPNIFTGSKKIEGRLSNLVNIYRIDVRDEITLLINVMSASMGADIPYDPVGATLRLSLRGKDEWHWNLQAKKNKAVAVLLINDQVRAETICNEFTAAMCERETTDERKAIVKARYARALDFILEKITVSKGVESRDD